MFISHHFSCLLNHQGCRHLTIAVLFVESISRGLSPTLLIMWHVNLIACHVSKQQQQWHSLSRMTVTGTPPLMHRNAWSERRHSSHSPKFMVFFSTFLCTKPLKSTGLRWTDNKDANATMWMDLMKNHKWRFKRSSKFEGYWLKQTMQMYQYNDTVT